MRAGWPHLRRSFGLGILSLSLQWAPFSASFGGQTGRNNSVTKGNKLHDADPIEFIFAVRDTGCFC